MPHRGEIGGARLGQHLLSLRRHRKHVVVARVGGEAADCVARILERVVVETRAGVQRGAEAVHDVGIRVERDCRAQLRVALLQVLSRFLPLAGGGECGGGGPCLARTPHRLLEGDLRLISPLLLADLHEA